MMSKELQYNKIYEKTKDFGRSQFVREIQMQINENRQLQQENKQLKEELYEAQRQNNELEQDGQDIAKELAIRIDKAIEYIENNSKPYAFSDKMLKKECIFKLLEILKGDSNE